MVTKVCSNCKETKNVSLFNKHSNKLDGLQSWCMPCYKEHQAAAYIERSAALFEYKGGKCNHCGVRDLEYPSMYDYHHTNPANKYRPVTSLMLRKTEVLYAEADKCVLLCANCHRKEHARLREETKDNEPQPKQEKQEHQEQRQTFQYVLC